MKKIIAIILVVVCFGCGLKKEFEFSGQTMGTTYQVKIVAWNFNCPKDMRAQIEERLNSINQSMSTYIADSEINRFNAMGDIEKKFFVSNDFLNVAQVAKQVYSMTEGAWDGSVMPLVRLWGFAGTGTNNDGIRADIPDQETIRNVLRDVGFEKIEISDQGYLKKKQTGISIDFASIAKGYAVDQVATLIREKGFDDFLVEIGGEVYASGFRLDGQQWRVGISTPRKNSPLNKVYEIVSIQNKALATSGDYRIFFEVDGHQYSHILDPRTGYPVTNGVVSVSIIADTCVFADGLATGVLVMGPSKGMDLINRLDGVECLLVKKEGAELINYYSTGFKEYKQ